VRWKRVVISAGLGGLLGFGGQFVVDFFWSSRYCFTIDGQPVYKTESQMEFPNGISDVPYTLKLMMVEYQTRDMCRTGGCDNSLIKPSCWFGFINGGI
jgi:hypothetical protein